MDCLLWLILMDNSAADGRYLDNKGESLAFWLKEFFDNIFYSYHYVVIELCFYLFGVGAAGKSKLFSKFQAKKRKYNRRRRILYKERYILENNCERLRLCCASIKNQKKKTKLHASQHFVII